MSPSAGHAMACKSKSTKEIEKELKSQDIFEKMARANIIGEKKHLENRMRDISIVIIHIKLEKHRYQLHMTESIHNKDTK